MAAFKRAFCVAGAGTRRALREFADWQRASAQLRRHDPAEILAFGRLADYFQVGMAAIACKLDADLQIMHFATEILARPRLKVVVLDSEFQLA